MLESVYNLFDNFMNLWSFLKTSLPTVKIYLIVGSIIICLIVGFSLYVICRIIARKDIEMQRDIDDEVIKS